MDNHNQKIIIPVLTVLAALLAAGCQNNLKSMSFLGDKATVTAEAPGDEFHDLEAGQDRECPPTSPHSVAESIAEKYDQDYEDVIDWYCSGYLFEDILVALQTSRLSDQETPSLLKLSEDQTWFEIWEDLGLNP